MLSDITFNFESEYISEYDNSTYGIGSTYEISFSTNWFDEKEKIKAFITGNFEKTSNYSVGNNYSYLDNTVKDFDLTLDVDYIRGKWDLNGDCNLSNSYSRNNDSPKKNSKNDSIFYKGKCSKDDGFSFSFDNDWTDYRREYYYHSYYNNGYKKIPVDSFVDIDINLSNKSTLEREDADYENLLDWRKSDFERFSKDFRNEFNR